MLKNFDALQIIAFSKNDVRVWKADKSLGLKEAQNADYSSLCILNKKML